MKVRIQDKRLKRESSWHLSLPNEWDIPVTFIANEEISLEKTAVDELSALIETQATVNRLQKEAPGFFDESLENRINQVVLTPDFHKGSGVPIGTVIKSSGFILPQAVGNDVNCGMRLSATSINVDQLRSGLDDLEKELRRIFFEGGRDIPMTRSQRMALLQYGLPGLIDTMNEANGKGLWAEMQEDREIAALDKMHGSGSYAVKDIFGLEEYLKRSEGATHDSIIGNVGGGNHFAEIQYVRKILNPAAAYAWGLKEGQVVMMIHSGSLGLGHCTGRFAMDTMKAIYPEKSKYPDNGVFMLPDGDRFENQVKDYFCSLANSANFAFGNRFFLDKMILRGLKNVMNTDVESSVIYDAPHNLVWEKDGSFVHRKGATPAGGWAQAQDTAYRHWGEPVIVPGSMGAPSYLLLGQGNEQTLCSACHGAGRQIARGAAMKVDDEEIEEFLENFRIVTALDHRNPAVKGRRDIMEKWKGQLKQEAPATYKNITPVIETLTTANAASPVVELYPLMTVKN